MRSIRAWLCIALGVIFFFLGSSRANIIEESKTTSNPTYTYGYKYARENPEVRKEAENNAIYCYIAGAVFSGIGLILLSVNAVKEKKD